MPLRLDPSFPTCHVPASLLNAPQDSASLSLGSPSPPPQALKLPRSSSLLPEPLTGQRLQWQLTFRAFPGEARSATDPASPHPVPEGRKGDGVCALSQGGRDH